MVDMQTLAQTVRDGLEAYVIPEHRPHAQGEPLPAQWFAAGLAEMRASLVSPYWIEMRDLDPQSGDLVVLEVAVVADAGDQSLVAFDPSADEFVTVMREHDPDRERRVDAVSCGLRGDAVEYFLSR